MFKVLYADKDAYITNRVIDGSPQVNSNVGSAGSLDLFKLYGYTSTTSGSTTTPNLELSRLLVHFDLTSLRQMVALGQVDPGSPTFSARLHLHDVYGGQPTPNSFYVAVYPLSASFDEGLGRDVVYYSDMDACSWLTSSFASGSWFITGCGLGGSAQQQCDYITASSQVSAGASLEARQFFKTGLEDLDVDVTLAVSATLASRLPDVGFRISLDPALEADTHSYFVKRFASRSAFNDTLQPKLYIRFDDSVQDDTDNLFLDSRGYLFLYNYAASALTNLVSGSTSITGNNCLVLQLQAAVSGGMRSLFFTGSQLALGVNPQTGIYSASVLVPSTDPLLQAQWQASGSLAVTPIWQSLDGTVAYLTGSPITVLPPQRGPASLAPHRFNVTVFGLKDEHLDTEVTTLRVNLFDYTQPYLLEAVRLPVELPGSIIRDVHYQVRDSDSGSAVVPFDTVTNSTRLSNDSSGMFFKIDMGNLAPGRSYVIDIMVVTNNNQQLYRGASPAFRVVAVP
jgi:hypothetical protein